MFFTGRIVMLFSRGDNNKGAGMQVIFLLHYLGGAIPFHAIDEYVLVCAVKSLPVMVFGFWIITDIGNIKIADDFVPGALVR